MRNQYDPVRRLDVAAILRRKSTEVSGTWRRELEEMASKIEQCREENFVNGFKEDGCKARMCPAYMATRHAVPAANRMRAQFAPVPLGRLFFIRLTHPDRRVTGDELAQARRDLLYAVLRLTQSRAWRETFLSWGGTVHLEWRPSSKKHGQAGFNVHLHLICEADDDDPDVDSIEKTWRKIIGSPNSAADPIYLEPVEEFDAAATYVPHVENLIPGYEEDSRGRLFLERMPVRDIFAFLDATKGAHRLLKHRFNRARRPGHRVTRTGGGR
jgi:hypothetical protein